MHPEISFQHTLNEIAVNRADPCELIRELISNSYDASASEIIIAPFMEKKGLIFFDNGVGLSPGVDAGKNISPYKAFFSIGRTTKDKGRSIGYKCQGSKLCFASRKFTVVTRCKDETLWRVKALDLPRNNLNTNTDLTPTTTDDVSKLLKDGPLGSQELRSLQLLSYFSQDFFKNKTSGTLIIIEEFDAADYDLYFSSESGGDSYVYNYIRFMTAHGDTRHITKEQGFNTRDTNTFHSHRQLKPASLILLKNTTVEQIAEIEIPYGLPYIPTKEGGDAPASPANIGRLRDGRFHARYAHAFKFQGNIYSIILAIDGKRRALTEYNSLGRQGQKGCGIPLASQRGTFLAAQGVKICRFNELYDTGELSSYSALTDGNDHYILIIDGPFELVTNRNSPAPSTLSTLQEKSFLSNVKSFLDDVYNGNKPGGSIFKELVNSLNQARTEHREEAYTKMSHDVRHQLPARAKFLIKNEPSLADKWFYEPQPGEEHFVGTLYTLFAHLIKKDSPAAKFWSRPLNFAGYGIDSIACSDESKPIDSLEFLEYKYTFKPDIEFNHPFSITNTIICWDYSSLTKDVTITDNYDYAATCNEMLVHDGKEIGATLNDVRHLKNNNSLGHNIRVISLRRLLEVTFEIQKRAALPPSTKK